MFDLSYSFKSWLFSTKKFITLSFPCVYISCTFLDLSKLLVHITVSYNHFSLQFPIINYSLSYKGFPISVWIFSYLLFAGFSIYLTWWVGLNLVFVSSLFQDIRISFLVQWGFNLPVPFKNDITVTWV